MLQGADGSVHLSPRNGTGSLSKVSLSDQTSPYEGCSGLTSGGSQHIAQISPRHPPAALAEHNSSFPHRPVKLKERPPRGTPGTHSQVAGRPRQQLFHCGPCSTKMGKLRAPPDAPEPECTGTYRNVPKHTETYRKYRNVPKRTEMYRNVPEPTETYRVQLGQRKRTRAHG